jgi:hypothetical protein
MRIAIDRCNKVIIEFENGTKLEVIDDSRTLDEIQLWFIQKDGEVVNLMENMKL